MTSWSSSSPRYRNACDQTIQAGVMLGMLNVFSALVLAGALWGISA